MDGKGTGRMEVKDFARWVKKNNDSDCRKSIFAEAGFAGLAFLYALFGDDNGIGYYGGGALLLVFAAFSIGRHQWERYFYVSEGDIPGKRMPVSQVLRFHAFPAEAYFRYVFSRMNRPFFRVLLFSGIMVFLAWEKVGGKGYEMAAFFVGLGIFCAICPYLFGFIMKKHFLFQLKTGNEGMSHLFLRGIAALWTAVECIILVMSLVVGLLLFWIVVSSFLELPMEETVAVCRSYPNKYSIFAVLICIAMWIFGMENNDTKKLSRFFYMISFLSLVSAFVLGTVENYRYTEIAGEEIRIRNFWQEDVYGIEEIQGFRIYEDDGSIQLELDFPDRAVEKSFTGWQSLNDLYEEKYYSEYNFIADYVEKFQKLGIEGELGDVEALEKDVEELDPEVQRGLKRIVELMGNYKTLTKL